MSDHNVATTKKRTRHDIVTYITYSCHLADSLGRFNITVPAMEVTPGTNYTCNITNRVPDYQGVQAGKVTLDE